MTAPATFGPAAAGQDRFRVAQSIRAAAETTGVPFDFLLAQANQESRLDPEARSSRSSAQGLFQFTRGTWLEMIKKHGGEHGLGRLAEAVSWGKGGWTVTDRALKAEILDLRRDPEVSALMAAEYAKDNRTVLEARLGRPASAQDLYLAHFLGAGGAARVIEGADDSSTQSASHALPEAARANPELFHDRHRSRPRSVASLHDALRARFDQALKGVAQLARRASVDRGLASLRPEPRPEPPVEVAAAVPPAPAPALTAYPVALPPPVSTNLRAAGPVLRLMLKAQEDGEA